MNWVLWGHDIFGPDSGRTKQYCKKIFTNLGVTCILPDFFRGKSGFIEGLNPLPVWDTGLRDDWRTKLLPYIREGGGQRVGAVGTRIFYRGSNIYDRTKIYREFFNPCNFPYKNL